MAAPNPDQTTDGVGTRLMRVLSFLTWLRLLGAVLLLAAGFKALTAVGPASVAVVAVEALLGLWLITGVYPTASRWLACLCFITFLAVSFHKALAGDTSCGCFGQVNVSPWLTAAFDAAVIVSLFLFVPERGAPRQGWLATAAVLVAVSFGAAPHVASLAAGWPVQQDGVREAVDPRLWLGRPLAVPEDTWDGRGVDEGHWFVAFYSPGCAACGADFDRLCEAGRGEAEGQARIAVVEVPASGAAARHDFTRADVRGRLAAGSHFAAPTPLVLEVRDGIVVGYAHSAEIASR